MNPLEQLSEARAMILIDATTLVHYLRADREETFMEGVRQAKLATQASHEAPLTKREAAEALGFSEGTIDNMRRRGELESYEYGGQVRIERSEIERFKR
ncbi:MAG: helix-turn-helix domain-containing protein, partial [Bacteroides sp.]|nr:helix-turn-helix domain-containing protein [Bacteroides sp.]MCM1402790.1 helix-turn-helix domain-containing protein [Bacteroides sp.]MCM1442235.1 helix-turn-helix domain-containing protein [Muribaculum sp.]